MSRTLKGFALAFGGMSLLASNYITAKVALERFNPLTFSILWYAGATGYLLILTLVFGQGRQILTRGRELWIMLSLGLALTCSASVGWYALRIMDPTFSAFLGRFTPVWAILLGTIMLKEKVRPYEWCALTVIIGGGAMSTLGGTWRLEWLGITLTLIATFFTAFQLTLGRLFRSNLPPLVMNLYRTTVAALLFSLWGLVMGGVDASHGEVRHWTALFAGALFGPCLSMTLIYASYLYWDVTRSAMILTLQPLVVLPLAYLMFHEIPGGWKLVGGLIIVAGGLWLVSLHRPPVAKPSTPDTEGTGSLGKASLNPNCHSSK